MNEIEKNFAPLDVPGETSTILSKCIRNRSMCEMPGVALSERKLSHCAGVIQTGRFPSFEVRATCEQPRSTITNVAGRYQSISATPTPRPPRQFPLRVKYAPVLGLQRNRICIHPTASGRYITAPAGSAEHLGINDIPKNIPRRDWLGPNPPSTTYPERPKHEELS